MALNCAIITSQSIVLAHFESPSKIMPGSTPGRECKQVQASVGTYKSAEILKEQRGVSEPGLSELL